MNDFIHKVRNSNKRFDQNNRKYNPNQENGFERKSGPPRRSGGYNKTINDQLLDLVCEILPDIQYFLEENTRRNQFMFEIEEQKVLIEEQKALSMQSIADSLARMDGQMPQNKSLTQNKSLNRSSAEKDLNVVEFPVEADIETENDLSAMQTWPNMQTTGKNPQHSAPDVSRDDVITMIRTLREDGKSFKQVALFLEEENIPTFSGKGRWHAPTIANLLKR